MDIVIVGLGSIAGKHIRSLRELVPGARIHALRSGKGGKDIPGISNVYSWEEIPQKPHFILISNPTGLHATTIQSALNFRCPLFIEKPVLMDMEESRELLPALRHTGIPTYVACNLRFLDCIAFVKRHLQESRARINEVSLYCGSYLPDWRPGQDFRTSYSADPRRGGGVQLDLIHELDYLYWIFGKPGQVTGTKRNHSSLGIPANDFAHYVCQYPEFTAMVTLNYFRRDPRRTFEIVFEDKTWQVDLLKNRIMEGESLVFESHQMIQDTYLAQMKYFLRCIESGNPCMNGFEEALEVLELCLS